MEKDPKIKVFQYIYHSYFMTENYQFFLVHCSCSQRVFKSKVRTGSISRDFSSFQMELLSNIDGRFLGIQQVKRAVAID